MIQSAVRSSNSPNDRYTQPPENYPGPNAGTNNSVSTFNAKAIGYFDPDSTKAAVEVKENYNIYHNVYSFIQKVNVKASLFPVATLQLNLENCLLGAAERWFTEELSDLSRNGLRYGPEANGAAVADKWSKVLQERFKESPSRALTVLETLRFTVRDVRAGKDPLAFLMEIKIQCQNSGVIIGESAQAMYAYEHIDAALRQHLIQPSPTSSWESLVASVREKKNIWQDLFQRTYTNAQDSYQKTNVNAGQYNRRSFNSREEQHPRASFPAANGFNNFKPFGNRGYSNYTNNPNGYRNHYNSFPNQGQSSANRIDQPNQRAYSNARALPPGNQTLRITDGGKYTGSSYAPKNNAMPQDRTAKAYNGDVDTPDGNHCDEPGEQYLSYEEASTDVNDNQYQEDYLHQQDEPMFIDPGMPESEQQFEHDYLAANWSSAVNEHSCKRCSKSFESNNKLHEHLRKDGCKKKVAFALPTGPNGNVVKSTAPQNENPGHAFKGYRYATMQVAFTKDQPPKDVCLDTGCTMSLIDREFLLKVQPSVKLNTLEKPLQVSGIGQAKLESTEWVLLTLYVKDMKGQMASITREFHLVDKLKANALMGIDIIMPERMTIDMDKKLVTLPFCGDLRIPIEVVSKGKIARSVYSLAKSVIPAKCHLAIPVAGRQGPLMLPENRDLLFEPSHQNSMTMFGQIVDCNLSSVMVYNGTNEPVVVNRHTKLGNIVDHDIVQAYLVDGDENDIDDVFELASTPPKDPTADMRNHEKVKDLLSGMSKEQVGKGLNVNEHKLINGVTIYGDQMAFKELSSVIREYAMLWEDTGNVKLTDSQFMEIPLIENWREIYKPGQAKIYPVSPRDREVIDKTFDELHEQERMEWTNQSTPFSFPCFVVWKSNEATAKGRVVIDIRALNKISMPDAYPMPTQSDILSQMAGSMFITTVDCTSFYYQWWTRKEHRHRLTVVSHRGQETFRVPVMGYCNSGAYVQRQIDRLLRSGRGYCRAYQDDVVIFSKSLQEHVSHLRHIFGLMKTHNITLAPHKSFIGYPSVKLLGQRVDAFGMATAEDKLKAIQNLSFPRSLKDLETYIGMTGYLRQYIKGYSSIVKPLQDRKTMLTKDIRMNGHEKGNKRESAARRALLSSPSETELSSFEALQRAFAQPTTLVHFNKARKLYIDLDASKKVGFGAMVYHVKEPNASAMSAVSTPKQKDVEPILFLSRSLSDAETRYWPTELEVAALVWTVKKIRHMIEASETPPIIVFTDHSATVAIAKQTSLNTTSIEKLNLRLVRASEYLQRFPLEIRHKPGKTNTVPDALSRLPTTESIGRSPNTDSTLESLYADTIPCYPTTIVQMKDSFKQQILEGYSQGDFQRILNAIRSNKKLATNAANLPFVEHNDLLYFKDPERGLRLCIPKNIQSDLFKANHDDIGHPGFARTHERLVEQVYIRDLTKHLKEYIQGCNVCSMTKTPRHKPYGSMQPITPMSRPFHTLTMDFILGLPPTWILYSQ